MVGGVVEQTGQRVCETGCGVRGLPRVGDRDGEGDGGAERCGGFVGGLRDGEGGGEDDDGAAACRGGVARWAVAADVAGGDRVDHRAVVVGGLDEVHGDRVADRHGRPDGQVPGPGQRLGWLAVDNKRAVGGGGGGGVGGFVQDPGQGIGDSGGGVGGLAAVVHGDRVADDVAGYRRGGRRGLGDGQARQQHGDGRGAGGGGAGGGAGVPGGCGDQGAGERFVAGVVGVLHGEGAGDGDRAADGDVPGPVDRCRGQQQCSRRRGLVSVGDRVVGDAGGGAGHRDTEVGNLPGVGERRGQPHHRTRCRRRLGVMLVDDQTGHRHGTGAVSYTHLRAHETDSY